MTALDSVLIVVVNHNTPKLTGLAVRSALRGSGEAGFPKLRVVVTNAACTSEGSYKDVSPDVKTIDTPFNIGFGAASNMAVAAAGGEWHAVLLLNSDAQIERDSLATLFRSLRIHPSVGAVGPKLVSPEGTLQREAARRIPRLSAEVGRLARRYGHCQRYAERLLFYPLRCYETPGLVQALSGACVLIRRAAWDAVGGLDERYFMYWEDIQLCRDIGAAGWQLLYQPEARCLHLGGGSTETPLHVEERASAVLFMSETLGGAMGIRALVGVDAGICLLKSALGRGRERLPARLLAVALGPRRLRAFDLVLHGENCREQGATAPRIVIEADQRRRLLGRSSCLVLSRSPDCARIARNHGHVAIEVRPCSRLRFLHDIVQVGRFIVAYRTAPPFRRSK